MTAFIHTGDAQERQQKPPAVADVKKALLLSTLQWGGSNSAQKQN